MTTNCGPILTNVHLTKLQKHCNEDCEYCEGCPAFKNPEIIGDCYEKDNPKIILKMIKKKLKNDKQ
jgi:hypothetical protein